jgi:hypothetical protein
MNWPWCFTCPVLHIDLVLLVVKFTLGNNLFCRGCKFEVPIDSKILFKDCEELGKCFHSKFILRIDKLKNNPHLSNNQRLEVLAICTTITKNHCVCKFVFGVQLGLGDEDFINALVHLDML